MSKNNFNTTINNKEISLFTLKNNNGVKVEITNFGGKVVSIHVPDKDGNIEDIVLGYDNIDDYISGNPYFGAIVGRYANRISKGKFTIEEKEYQLVQNNGENHLHGGTKGFNDIVWDVKQTEVDGNQLLELSYLSKDGEENYPGNLNVKVIYTLTQNNELKIAYSASTDKTTIVNITHHSFFNLAGEGKGTILDHKLLINADKFTVVNNQSIPTGEIRNVADTPMDFRKFTEIGERINADDEQLKFGNGYDHNWVLNRDLKKISFVAAVHEPISGRYMEVWTDQPGMQLYTGNYLDGSDIGKGEKAYHQHSAFCLETQHFPDSPNHPEFLSCILKPGEEYKQTCIYNFSVK
ncbi:MAG: aldose epimerase family protein [Bacteroidota bacterium]